MHYTRTHGSIFSRLFVAGPRFSRDRAKRLTELGILRPSASPAHTALVEAAKARPRDQRAAYLRSMLPSFGHFDFEDAVKALERGGELDSDSVRQLLAALEDSASAAR